MMINELRLMNSNEVPLMFQAQVDGRGQVQYIADRSKPERWVDEWDEAVANLPKFGTHVRTKEYEISWRFLANSGQDDDIIRPVIGANGFPYYPGASMKGAFLRSCTREQGIRYCGTQTTQDTKPGILRFHGAYPKDDSWREQQLIDIVHPQEEWQVKNNNSHSAFLQISLYQPTLVFGISSNIELDDTEWQTIWEIWDRAIQKGIGSRVSAGYGQPLIAPEQNQNKLLSVKLRGKGLASQLIDKSGEFRPNIFKAALRGHTLRLLSGMINEKTAEQLTKELWGGFAGNNGAIVGDLGISFNSENLVMDEFRYNKVTMPTYDLKSGTLTIVCMKNPSPEYKKQLRLLAKAILRFSMLIGGFGKSSRRIDHREFLPEYLDNQNKPMIGCHWEFIPDSKDYYFLVNNILHIKNAIDKVRQTVEEWLRFKGITPENVRCLWRESFHPQNVQIWGRIAEDKDDSLAVHWFHGNYQGNQSIKGSTLTGRMGNIGRIYHRMYPHHYRKTVDGNIVRRKSYVELLTIFPGANPPEQTRQFLAFLGTPASNFQRLWGD